MNKRGQVTIFIIVAILIVILVIMFFFIRKQVKPEIGQKTQGDPQSFLESCLENKVQDKIKLISSQGGYVENSLSKSVDGVNISYLCYTQNNYIPCTNQEPVLIDHLKKELKKATQNDIEKCFSSLRQSFEDKSYQVTLGNLDFNFDLQSKKVILNIKRDLQLSKNNENSQYDHFDIIFSNRLYDLAVVVQEITSQEARFCHFDTSGYMTFYPQYNIEEFTLGDSTKIYSVKDKKTNEQFVFLIRSCVIPPGIG